MFLQGKQPYYNLLKSFLSSHNPQDKVHSHHFQHLHSAKLDKEQEFDHHYTHDLQDIKCNPSTLQSDKFHIHTLLTELQS